MKYYIFSAFLLLTSNILGQTTYFSDTLNPEPIPNNPYHPYGAFVLPMPDNTCKIMNPNANLGLIMLQTDANYSYANYKKWGIDYIPNLQPQGNQMAKLPSQNWIVPMFARNANDTVYYNCFLKMNANMEDTLRSVSYLKRHPNKPSSSSSLGFIRLNQDSASFWAVGGYRFPDVYANPLFVSRIDTNFNRLSEFSVADGTKLCVVNNLLARRNNRCIIAYTSTTNLGSNNDNIRICKVNDSGVVWSKNYGNPNKIDATPYLFKGISDTTFWLVYTEGRTDTISTSGDFVAIRFRAVLLTDSGVELMSKYLIQPIKLFAYHQLALPLAGGGYLFGFSRSYKALFQRYDSNFNFLWESSPYSPDVPAIPGDYINPLHAAELPNGDFICTGEYSYNIPTTIWIGKMDSMGCWYDAGCSVATESPLNPSKEDLIKVFPTPTTGSISLIHAAGTTLKSYTIADISGKIIAENASIPSDNTLHLDLPSGVYFLIIHDVNGLVSKHKVVVIK